jgi:NADH:ubiquinone oxidoreductase subunit E
VKQLLTSLSLDDCSRPPTQSSLVAVVDSHVEAIAPVASAQIRVCQGASCRRRGSDGICRAMQTYLDQHDLTEQVEIKPVKCLHQCKTAPHAIVTQLSSGAKLEKTHYRQLQTYQIKAILDRHFPFAASVKPIQDNLITKISNYLQHQIGSTSTAI